MRWKSLKVPSPSGSRTGGESLKTMMSGTPSPFGMLRIGGLSPRRVASGDRAGGCFHLQDRGASLKAQ